MFYRLIGMVVWKGGKYFLKRKYPNYVPNRVLAGAAVAVAGGAAVLIVRHAGSDD